MEQPLSNIWELYSDSLDEALDKGYISDDDLSDEYIWPADLKFGRWEQEDVKKYVHERMTELVENVKNRGGVDPNFVASYIFRSVLCGMLWEKERIG
jgi:hypothetical protein